MTGIVLGFLSSVSRRVYLWAFVAIAFAFTLATSARRKNNADKADLYVRQADARIKDMQTAKEIHNEASNADRADLDRRAAIWMRD